VFTTYFFMPTHAHLTTDLAPNSNDAGVQAQTLANFFLVGALVHTICRGLIVAGTL
jgi:hypothetical protein